MMVRMNKPIWIFALLFGFPAIAAAQSTSTDLSVAAMERTRHQITYDGSYQSIAYPGGDVSPDTGVCTDVIIRSYRALGVDLQVLVHEDIKANFAAYPARWGLHRPDRNIDHRRVPNLQTFFTRNGQSIAPDQDPKSWSTGDLVTWMLPGNRPHIGIVTDQKAPGSDDPLVVHNAGLGPQLEDVLFAWPITGHYRYGIAG